MPLSSKKAMNCILTLDFCRRLSFSSWEDGEHHAIDCRFDSGSNWYHHASSPVRMFSKQWILITHGNEVSRSFHLFCFLLVCELVLVKSGADLPLIKIIADDGMHLVLANTQFVRNQS